MLVLTGGREQPRLIRIVGRRLSGVVPEECGPSAEAVSEVVEGRLRQGVAAHGDTMVAQ